MSIIEMLLKELDQESQTTRKMLQRVPDGKFDWKPHEKSMTIRQLATHIAELPSWISMALTTDGLDFADNPYDPVIINNTAGLLHLFEKSLADGKAHLAAAAEDQLEQTWTLRNGEQVLMSITKGETIRHAYSQTVHHRAQLGVYFRLLNIPVPASYGPSADEMI